MEHLRNRDLKAVIEFVEDAWAAAGERAFTHDTIAAMGRLIPCEQIGYTELDHVRRRVIEYVGNDEDEVVVDAVWDFAAEHPLCHRQMAYGDFAATRLSDVVSWREFVRTRIYADYFRPLGTVAEMEAGINESRVRTRNFILDRSSRDFSDRDRAVLELARPHLARIHEQSLLRRAVGTQESSDSERLTDREAEILELVGCGLTNAQIAERLWISSGTVKKHLDNIYAKLGVANRTAAARAVSARGSA